MNTHNNAPETLVEKTAVAMRIEFEIVSFENRVTTDDVLAEMKRRELNPADSKMLKTFIEGYRAGGDLNRLVALGDPRMRLIREHSYSRRETVPLMEATQYITRTRGISSSEPFFYGTNTAYGWSGRKEEAADYAKFLAYRLLAVPK